jgi:hypothetical protein
MVFRDAAVHAHWFLVPCAALLFAYPGLCNYGHRHTVKIPVAVAHLLVMSFVQDFEQLQLTDITSSIESRQNRIFLLMEEVRRLRIQQRLKVSE